MPVRSGVKVGNSNQKTSRHIAETCAKNSRYFVAPGSATSRVSPYANLPAPNKIDARTCSVRRHGRSPKVPPVAWRGGVPRQKVAHVQPRLRQPREHLAEKLVYPQIRVVVYPEDVVCLRVTSGRCIQHNNNAKNAYKNRRELRQSQGTITCTERNGVRSLAEYKAQKRCLTESVQSGGVSQAMQHFGSGRRDHAPVVRTRAIRQH